MLNYSPLDGGRRGRRSASVVVETLEQRQLLSSSIKFSNPAFYFNDIQSSASGGSGRSPVQSLVIRNAGKTAMSIPSGGLSLGGSNAGEFAFSDVSTPTTLQPGATRTLHLSFKAAKLGIRTATLIVKTTDPFRPTTNIVLRGLGTAGTGGLLEPSLQRILDLFQIPDKVGEPHPEQNPFPIPPSTPNDEVGLQRLMKAGSGPVKINLLAVFDNFKTPATEVGFYTPGNPASTDALFTVPMSDAQSVHPTINGATTFDPGSKEFGIYTVFPAFSFRNTFSEDNLNTWETNSANRKKIRFYPLKNSDGSKVANAYIFAAEDYNKAFDFNDVVGIIRNVKLSTAPPPVGGGGGVGGATGSGTISNIPNLAVANLDGLPTDDRLVFNRIEHLDEIRPNVFHDKSGVKLINKGNSTITIKSLTLGDNTNFKIISGGGSNIALAAGQSRTVVIQFVGSSTGSTILKTFASNLKITVGSTTDTVTLAGLWQSYSEQTPANPSHIYDEPSLPTIINTIFGYKSVLANPGQTTTHGLLVMFGTKGQRTAVGSEVLSAYWQAANSSQSVKVRMLAAFHRQSNFDTNGDPIPAASQFSYFYKGASSTRNKLIRHNDNEGQALLPHIAGSTTSPAQGSFSPGTKLFGFEVDKHYSDDTLNALDFDPKTGATFPNTGHSFRFYPLIDENGKAVANTWIAAEDNTANKYANWDYQDSIYLIYNVKPASTSSTQSLASTSPTSVFGAVPVKSSPNDMTGVLDSQSSDLL